MLVIRFTMTAVDGNIFKKIHKTYNLEEEDIIRYSLFDIKR